MKFPEIYFQHWALAIILLLGQNQLCNAALASDALNTSAEPVADGTAISSVPSSNSGGDASSATITLQKPELKALITIDERMNPYELEAASQQSLSLYDALRTAVDQNLDIGISHSKEKRQQWKYLGSLGSFLPDINTGYTLYGISGKLNLPIDGSASGTASTLPSQISVASAGFTYTGYQGGKVLFGALQNKNLLRASKAEYRSTLSDTLLSVTRDYYNLLLNEALLQVRIKAVATSNEQLRINNSLSNNGLATNLDVLQAKTQLSRDRQDLIDQQITRRSAAIQLATTLNSNLTDDLVPQERTLRKNRLVNYSLSITDLVKLAIDNRPELKQNEELRLAAKKAITVAAAGLQPTLKLSGTAYGVGSTVSNLTPLYTLAMSLNWNIRNLGTTDATEIQAARWQARQRLLEANKALIQITNEVRNSLLRSLQAERKITETADEVSSAQEELRLSKIRFEEGLGNNIDVITAQRDLTSALINKAQSIINFNTAQAQLLHDIGLISVDSLTTGTLAQKKLQIN